MPWPRQRLALAGLLLAVLFGAAGGNLARGGPLDDHGNFAMAFFTDFDVRSYVGLLDWYTLSVALFVVIVLTAWSNLPGVENGRPRA